MKKHKKLIVIISVVATILIAVAVVVTLILLNRIDYRLKDSRVFEINTEPKTSELFESISSGELINGEDLIETSNLGRSTKTAIIKTRLGNEEPIEIEYEVVDTTKPAIEGDAEFSIYVDESIDLISKFKFSDNSNQDIETKVEGDYDVAVPGKYNLKIIAKDQSNNETVKDIVLNVQAKPVVAPRTQISQNEYYIKVNRLQNVVMVYAKDSKGEYTNLAKTFVASTGKVGSETPLGIYTVSDRYEALYLVGNVWGRYAVRISGPYFFHSVPYFTKGNPTWDNLEYLEYNKLGEGASAGCVRLSLNDIKWIYYNIRAGTKVEIYDSETLPSGVVKPTAIKIDENSVTRGWDPTDTDKPN